MVLEMVMLIMVDMPQVLIDHILWNVVIEILSLHLEMETFQNCPVS